MARRLKVFRTPIGFHDAYVAATSRKAALAAWGSDADLFARGIAEEVTDPALTEAPLGAPGTVVRLARGTVAEHVAALPPDGPKVRPGKAAAHARPPAPKPRPSRVALDGAETALAAAERERDDALAGFRRREEALRDERRATEDAHARRIAKLEATLDQERRRHADALARWRGT